MRIVRHGDAAEFLERAEDWLLQREAEHNILLSCAYLVREGSPTFGNPVYFATVEADGQIVGCVLRPPPDGVYFTEIPRGAVAEVAAQLREIYVEIPEAVGPEQPAVEFARQWSGTRWRLHSRLQRYVLETVTPPERTVPGSLRHGRASDVGVLDEWAADYGREVGSKVDTRAFFRRMIERNLLYVWDDDGPRCVVTASGLTPNGARVSAAYTPPENRGKGYGANAVAAVSQTVLDGGKRFCVITADVEDPVPNAIYRKIGYEPVSELALVHIDP